MMNSAALRFQLLSCVRKNMRAVCMLSVEAP